MKILLIDLIKALYGEFFNKNVPYLTRIKRVVTRFNISRIFIYFIKNFNKNKKIITVPTIFSEINHSNALKKLQNDGIFDDIFLPQSEVNKILEYCKNNKFNFNRNKNYKLDFSNRFNQKDLYIMNINNPHLNCHTIDKIARDEKIINLIKDYFEMNPIISSSQIFWSIPCFDENNNIIEPPNNEYGYHYDVDGFKFLKLFFYLTDVKDEKDGSHIYIKRGNKNKKLIQGVYRRVSDKFIEKNFSEQIYEIFGKKGKGFLEDTSNYHKGSAPFNERGILSIVYNISKW